MPKAIVSVKNWLELPWSGRLDIQTVPIFISLFRVGLSGHKCGGKCPPAKDGTERFACPSPDHTNRYRCIDDHSLCDGFIDCPNAEDEDMGSCMFYKTTKAHLDVLADALLRWARGRY
ncbi:hypothetical protein AVEN_269810-1 [Araneus ventricosus]|uniref:Uncharacterized protein n=1 Tax=Araneus ventricosus TaxID=182803 RepID=A0A4Y2JIX2_ARAVE|nr:hypothetical protein AVEN_269810-1 [Araneus ventricosus]